MPPERVPEVWAGVTGLFRDHGYRRSRNYARLKFLVGDWGPERLREVLEREYLSAPLDDGPAPPPSPSAQRDHVGVFAQADGRRYVGAAPRAGRTSGGELVRVAELADEHGSGRVRLTTQQKIVVLDVAPERVERLVAALEEMDLQVGGGPLRRTAMACTGNEFCKIAVVETKSRTDALVRELERRLPDLDEPVRIHMNGGPNSCARFQLADIGLLGSLVQGDDGERVEGFQVHLGGHLGPRAAVARRVKGSACAARSWTTTSRVCCASSSTRARTTSPSTGGRRAPRKPGWRPQSRPCPEHAPGSRARGRHDAAGAALPTAPPAGRRTCARSGPDCTTVRTATDASPSASRGSAPPRPARAGWTGS